MHKTPLTQSERLGLTSHNLTVDAPSQLSDCFRLGMAWEANNPSTPQQTKSPQQHLAEYMKEWLSEQDSSTREAWGEVSGAVMDALSDG